MSVEPHPGLITATPFLSLMNEGNQKRDSMLRYEENQEQMQNKVTKIHQPGKGYKAISVVDLPRRGQLASHTKSAVTT